MAEGPNSENNRAQALSACLFQRQGKKLAGAFLGCWCEHCVAVLLSSPPPWAGGHFRQWGASGGAITSGPARDLIGLPRWLIHYLADRARGSLGAGPLPARRQPAHQGVHTASHWWVSAGGAPSPPGTVGEARDKLPFKRQCELKMPSCSSDCFFQFVEVRFFFLNISHSPKGCILWCVQSVFPALWIAPLGVPLPGSHSFVLALSST